MTNSEIMKNIGNESWRLDHLYKIKNKYGAMQDFRMTPIQWLLYRKMCNKNFILKSRQFGITTYMAISMLDNCLFSPNIKCCAVPCCGEHGRCAFNDKIMFSYENLPVIIREAHPIKAKTKNKITFSGDSFLNISASIPPGTTFQQIYISEYGYICRKAPKRARKIQINLDSAEKNCIITIDSGGKFVDSIGDYDKKLLEAIKGERECSDNKYKIFFFPWWQNPDKSEFYEDGRNVDISPALKKYFKSVEKRVNIKLTSQQKAWYAKMKDCHGVDMPREYPSLRDEAIGYR